MIREIPNRYEKLNFSSDDIQNQLETRSQGSPARCGQVSQGEINPTFSKPNILRESRSILNSLSSSRSSSNDSVKTNEDKSARRCSISSSSKSIDPYLESSPKNKTAVSNLKKSNSNYNNIVRQNKFQKIVFKRLPTSSNNSSQNTLIKESLTNPFTQAQTKQSYFVQTKAQNVRFRRLLSFHGEETGEFRELVTFLDQVQKNDEMPAHKMIRKNSCCCQNCGTKTSKEVYLDKLIPKFKPTQVIKMMYRKAFQNTINNVSKINKFFKSKLSIRTNNNNHLVFGEKKASPNKFMRQSTFKISPKSVEKTKIQRPSINTPDSLIKIQPANSLNFLKQKDSILQMQSSNSQNDTPVNQQPSGGNSAINDARSKRTPTFVARSSLLVYSNGEQHQQFLSKLQQLPFKKSVFNPPSPNSSDANTNGCALLINQDQKGQQPNATNNLSSSASQNNFEADKHGAAPPKLSNTPSNISVGSSSNGNNMNNTNANNNGPNTPQIRKRSLGVQLEQLKLKNQATSSITVEDKIIDQLRKETKMGNINNDFVKSVGNNILRQSLGNLPRDPLPDIDSERRKSIKTDEVIFEDASEIGHHSIEKARLNRDIFASSYYRHFPKFSCKYLNPVLSQNNSSHYNHVKKEDSMNNQSQFYLKTLEEIQSDGSLDFRTKLYNNHSAILPDSRNTTQASSDLVVTVGKNHRNLYPQSQKSSLITSPLLPNPEQSKNSLFRSNNSIGNISSQYPGSTSLKREGSKKILMKRQSEKNIFSSQKYDSTDSVFNSNQQHSSQNFIVMKKQNLLQQNSLFKQNHKSSEYLKNGSNTSKLRDSQYQNTAHRFPQKINQAKASLPEIKVGQFSQPVNKRGSENSSTSQPENLSLFQSQSMNSQSMNMVQTKGDLSPMKIMSSKKKKNTKSKSHSKINYQFMEIYQKQFSQNNNIYSNQNNNYHHQVTIPAVN